MFTLNKVGIGGWMVDDAVVFREELVPVLEQLEGYTVVDLVEGSLNARVAAGGTLNEKIREREFSVIWEPLDALASGVTLDYLFPTHLLVSESVDQDQNPSELYKEAAAVFDIVTKHVEVKDESLEDKLRSFASEWEAKSPRDELFVFAKYPLDVSEVTFTVRHGASFFEAQGEELEEAPLRQLKEVFEQIDAELSDQMMSLYYPRAVLNAVTVTLGEKRGAFLEGRVPATETIDELVDALRSLGVSCVVKLVEFDNFPPYVNLLMSRDGEMLQKNFQVVLGEETSDEFDRISGRLYGYPDHAIEHYIDTKEEEERENTLNIVRKYGYSPEQVKKVQMLVHYGITDSEEQAEEVVNVAEQRYRRLEEVKEEFGIDFLSYFDHGS